MVLVFPGASRNPLNLGSPSLCVAEYSCKSKVAAKFRKKCVYVQGGFVPSKKSGVGVDFELLVRCLLLENKVEARKPSMIFK